MNRPVPTKLGRPPKDRRRYIHIAATIDYRGTDDSQLFFLFRDPPYRLLDMVFKRLIAKGKGIAERVVITEEHDIIRRMGKGYWRKAVEIINPNYKLCSLDTMKLLIESTFCKLHICDIRWMTIDKFLNI